MFFAATIIGNHNVSKTAVDVFEVCHIRLTVFLLCANDSFKMLMKNFYQPWQISSVYLRV